MLSGDLFEFFIAAKNGDLSKLRELSKIVDANDDLFFFFESEPVLRPPLHIAAENGHFEIVDYLIRFCGADVNASDWRAFTALQLAVSNNHFKVCELLVDCGACVNLHSPISMAKTVKMARFLLSKGANLNPLRDILSPLHIAVCERRHKMCRFFVENGSNVNAISLITGETPLEMARRLHFNFF